MGCLPSSTCLTSLVRRVYHYWGGLYERKNTSNFFLLFGRNFMNLAYISQCSYRTMRLLLQLNLPLNVQRHRVCAKKSLFTCTTTSSTTPYECLIDLFASVRVTFDGFIWTLHIFLSIEDNFKLILAPRSHRAFPMDNFTIKLKLPGLFFYGRNRHWKIILQLLVRAIYSSSFNFCFLERIYFINFA